MKIGHFISHFPYKEQFKNKMYVKNYVCRGTEVAVHNLVTNLSKRHHEISIFTSSINSKGSIEKYGNLNVYRYGSYFEIGDTRISLGLFIKPFQHDVEIVHVHNNTPPGVIAGFLYAKIKNKPLIITHHGCENFDNYGSLIRKLGLSLYINFLLEKIFSCADVIISPSEAFIEESKFLKKYRDKVVVIPNGINMGDFDIPYSKEECREKLGLSIEKNIILYLGSLIPRKGPDVLVKAMHKIIKVNPDTELVLAGDGILRKELEELSKKLGLNNHIKLVGFVKEGLKPLYYKAADVFVLPSTVSMEVFPVVILEASASGIPIVVSDLDTFKCIIERRYNGLFTKRNDENNLADAIIYLLENEDVRREMGKNARKKVEDYSWERIAEETEKVYNEVIS